MHTMVTIKYIIYNSDTKHIAMMKSDDRNDKSAMIEPRIGIVRSERSIIIMMIILQ